MNTPEKYFYTIGDVSKTTHVKPHILRYWETHFKILRPARRYSGHRKYTQREIDLIQKIRYLVVDRKFTLSGAKKEIYRHLNKPPKPTHENNNAKPTLAPESLTLIEDIKKDVEECLKILEPKPMQAELGLN